MPKNAKGSTFERDICRTLSLWWTEGARDDVFYRTPNSGGRATSRAKKDKKTANQSGDISASDPIGQPFLQMFAIEMKRGYNGEGSLADILDAKKGPTLYEKWVDQACKSAKQSGSKHWMLIVRRDKRQAIVILPGLLSHGTLFSSSSALIGSSTAGPLFVLTLERFIQETKPDDIKGTVLSNAPTGDPAGLPEASKEDTATTPKSDNDRRKKRRR